MIHTKKEKPTSETQPDIASFLGTVSKRPRLSFFRRVVNRFKKPQLVLINMELRNGKHTTFTVDTCNRGFLFKDGIYLFDDTLKYEHLSSGLFAYDFHEDLNLPVQRRIRVNDLKKSISESGICEVELATNPSTLQSFIDSRIVSEILQSGSMVEQFMQKMKTILFAILIITLLHMILFAAKSGIFSTVKTAVTGG